MPSRPFPAEVAAPRALPSAHAAGPSDAPRTASPRGGDDERYRGLSEGSPLGIFETDRHGDVVYVNPRLLQLWGATEAELRGREWRTRVHPQDLPALLEKLLPALDAGRDCVHECRLQRADGAVRWLRGRAAPRYDGNGTAVGLVGTIEDVTERRRADDELRRQALTFAVLHDAVIVTDVAGDVVDWNPAAERTFGYARAEMLGRPTRVLYPDDAALVQHAAIHAALLADGRWDGELRFRRRDGTEGARETTVVPLRDAEGRFSGAVSVSRDVTERVRAAAALRESERRAAAQLEGALDCVVTIDATGRILEFNPAAEQTFGYARAEAVGRPIMELLVPPAARAGHREGLARYLATGEARILGRRVEVPGMRADGSTFAAELTVIRLPVEGAPVFTAFIRDISERKAAEDALRTSEQRFRLAARAASDIVYDWDIARNTVFWGPTLGPLFGYELANAGTDVRWWLERVHPDGLATVRGTLDAIVDGTIVDGTFDGAVTDHGRPWTKEYRFRRADGTYASVLDRGYLLRDEAGRPARVVGSMTDLTERERLQAQLRQAQKMEAVGRLTGGIAHDFNNILTAITGFGELVAARLPEGTAVARDMQQVLLAADRAAALTRQLLAFSRQQVLHPEPLHVNRVVAAVEQMLRRVIGADVTLALDLASPLDLVHADAGQLEQVLMNLALNARDAMPAGGRLTIATANVRLAAESADRPTLPPGAYVALRVCDTGAGMDEATRARVFEPFFSTKALGKGTGLGLATVYGIVTQSGGDVSVESAPGAGTSFTVLLPAVARAAATVAPAPPVETPPPAPHPRPRGAETVLLVEDEPSVRTAVRRMLEGAGYTVLEARHGVEALAVLDARGDAVALVLTDVVMPEMGGCELAGHVRARRPDVRVVLMSGYSAEAVAQRGGPVERAPLLAKPFTVNELLRRVREALDAPLPG